MQGLSGWENDGAETCFDGLCWEGGSQDRITSPDCGRVSDEVKEIRFVLSNAPIVNELLAVMDRTRCRATFAHGSTFQRHVHRGATVVYYAMIRVCICRCVLARDTPTLNAYGSR